MTLDAIRPRDAIVPVPTAAQPSASSDREPKSPDFSSSIFSAVHLPTGLIGHASRPTLATVKADARDVLSKTRTLLADMQSPEIQQYVKSGAKLYDAFIRLNLCVGSVAKALASVEQGDTDKLLDGVKNGFEIPDKLRALVAAHHEFAKANGAKTNAAFAKVVRDVASLEAAQAKLGADVLKAVAP